MKVSVKKLTCLGAVVLLTIATASVANNNYGHAQDVETLDTAQLRQLLRNVSLTRVEDPGVITSDPGTETFYESGEYVRWGDRAHRRGTFEIANGRYCVRLSPAERPECYRIQRDQNGRIWRICGRHNRVQVTLVERHDLDGDWRILRGSELRILLSDVAVQEDNGSVRTSHPITEHYRADGRFVRWSRGGGHEGTFEINDDRVCVRFLESTSSECFRISVDPDGRFRKLPENDSEATRILITRLPAGR